MYKVMVDIGHKDCDSGAVFNGIREVDLTTAICGYLKPMLEEQGITVKYSTGTLNNRVKLEKSWKPNIFVSVHINAGGGDGTEVFCYKFGGRGQTLATKVYNQIVNIDKLNNGRGVKEGNFQVLRETSSPACLVEVAFIDTKDIQCVDEAHEQKAVAKSICKGILSYLGMTYKEIGSNNNTNKQDTVVNTNSTTSFDYNATIINDFFYTRTSNGTKDGGKIDIGTKVKVLDIIFSSQLCLVEYMSNGVKKKAYITNATNCIDYLYKDKWTNGSTSESVYFGSDGNSQIGTIYPNEKATLLYKENNMYKLVYKTPKGVNTKSGYVRYKGGLNI